MGRRLLAAAGILVASTVAWPAIQLAVFALRFKRLPAGGWTDSLVFAPMGLAVGLVAALLWLLAASARQRRSVLAGYLVASPVAFLGSLLGGLFVPGVWGPLLVGAVPLAAGCGIGFLLGRERVG